MRTYLAILKVRLSVLFQYRAAAFAGVATQIFWGLIKTMIITAFYSQTDASQPISLTQAITFIWLGQALLQLQPWSVDKEIESQVRNGNIAYELVRPIDLYWLCFFKSMALRLAPTLLRCVPLVIIAVLFLYLPAPFSPMAGFTFGISVVLAALLSTAITTLVMISLFWTISGDGILRLLPHTSMLLSGMIVPLPLFPEWLQPFLSIQPFRGIVDIPARLYTGVIPTDHAVYYLGFQLLWSVVLIVIGRALMNKAIKQVVIQGG